MQGETTQLLTAVSVPGLAQALVCPHCQQQIAAGEEFCPNCGFQRGSWPQTNHVATSDQAPVSTSGWRLRAEDGRVWQLPEGESIAGRGDVAVRIDESFVSRQHARLKVSQDSVTVEDLGSSNGTFTNEDPLQPGEQVSLSDGSVLRLGGLILTLEALPDGGQATAGAPDETSVLPLNTDDINPEPTTATPATSPWVLRAAAFGDFPLNLGNVTIGRRAGNTIVLPDGFVSGSHGQLVVSADQVTYTDLGSTNGSYIDGEQLVPHEPRILADGCVLRLGQLDAHLLLVHEMEDSDSPPSGVEDEPA